MSKIIIPIIFLIAVSCSHHEETFINETSKEKSELKSISVPPSVLRDCVCADVWMPVCGKNGKTYSNACFAKCAGVNFHQGSCDQVIKD
jgi:hypothetical protein